MNKPENNPVAVDLAQLAQLVIEAGKQELLPRFRQCGFTYKQDGSLLTEADLGVQNKIQDELARHYPQISMLGEEMSTQEQQAIIDSGKTFWCLDPLDGTSNFASGIPFFSISLALIENGQPVIGIIYDPLRDECFVAEKGQGTRLNETKLDATIAAHSTLDRCTAIIDFKRLQPELATRLATQCPYASQRSFGSVALDWVWLAAGRGQIYLHGKQKLWDYAAGWIILEEAGGYSSTLVGVKGFKAELTPRSAIAAPNQDLYQQWFNWLNG